MERRPPSEIPPDEHPQPGDDPGMVDRVEQEMITVFDQLPPYGKEQVMLGLIERLDKDQWDTLAEGLVEEYLERVFPIVIEDNEAYLALKEAGVDLSEFDTDDYGDIIERLIEECRGNIFYHVLYEEVQKILERKRQGRSRRQFGSRTIGSIGSETI